MQVVVVVMHALFLSTLSLRRATPNLPKNLKSEANFYPRSPYGERQQMEHLKIPAHGISIHALLAESDISVFWTALSRPLFLSTLSLRRATHYDNYNLHCVEISIHALLAESDAFF